MISKLMMNTSTTTHTRMLLSHNFDLGEGDIPVLSRAAFTQVFATALKDCAQCREVDNPHWIVEVLFDAMQITPAQMGDRLVKALADFRRSSLDAAVAMPEFVVLGGLKTSPPTSPSPDALQPNQWGVDVVETRIVAAFLAGLNWEAAIADRPPEGIFKSVIRGE
jgi:Protein of unknown function (DUF2656)